MKIRLGSSCAGQGMEIQPFTFAVIPQAFAKRPPHPHSRLPDMEGKQQKTKRMLVSGPRRRG